MFRYFVSGCLVTGASYYVYRQRIPDSVRDPLREAMLSPFLAKKYYLYAYNNSLDLKRQDLAAGIAITLGKLENSKEWFQKALNHIIDFCNSNSVSHENLETVSAILSQMADLSKDQEEIEKLYGMAISIMFSSLKEAKNNLNEIKNDKIPLCSPDDQISVTPNHAESVFEQCAQFYDKRNPKVSAWLRQKLLFCLPKKHVEENKNCKTALLHNNIAGNLISMPNPDMIAARKRLQYALQLAKKDDSVHCMECRMAILNNLGVIAESFNENQKALEHYKNCLPLSRQLNDLESRRYFDLKIKNL